MAQFKKGQCGNPYGRPKKQEALTAILAEIGNLKDIKTKDGYIDRKTALGQRLWSIALSGDLGAIKYIYDRVDGTPRQSIDLDTKIAAQNKIDLSGMPSDQLDVLLEAVTSVIEVPPSDSVEESEE